MTDEPVGNGIEGSLNRIDVTSCGTEVEVVDATRQLIEIIVAKCGSAHHLSQLLFDSGGLLDRFTALCEGEEATTSDLYATARARLHELLSAEDGTFAQQVENINRPMWRRRVQRLDVFAGATPDRLSAWRGKVLIVAGNPERVVATADTLAEAESLAKSSPDLRGSIQFAQGPPLEELTLDELEGRSGAR